MGLGVGVVQVLGHCSSLYIILALSRSLPMRVFSFSFILHFLFFFSPHFLVLLVFYVPTDCQKAKEKGRKRRIHLSKEPVGGLLILLELIRAGRGVGVGRMKQVFFLSSS